MKMALSTVENRIFTLAALPMGVAGGVESERPAMPLEAARGANQQHLTGGDYMALEADNPQAGTAQRFIDPLVSQARLVNEATHIERRLAMRRELRAERSDAAKRGWEVRRDR
jgi:hypothetical protein